MIGCSIEPDTRALTSIPRGAVAPGERCPEKAAERPTERRRRREGVTGWPDLEAALQARDGWRRVGRAYHGPCPVTTGAGRDRCFASEGTTGGVALGCRQCGWRLAGEVRWPARRRATWPHNTRRQRGPASLLSPLPTSPRGCGGPLRRQTAHPARATSNSAACGRVRKSV